MSLTRPYAFSPPHIDSNSYRDEFQALATFGRFSGGKIAICNLPPDIPNPRWPAPPSSETADIVVPLKGPVGCYKRGTRHLAQVHCVLDRFLLYNPHALHQPQVYRGQRFSLVYFMSSLQVGEGPCAFNRIKVAKFRMLGFPEAALEKLGVPPCEMLANSREDPHPRKRARREESDVVAPDLVCNERATQVLHVLDEPIPDSD